MLLWRYYKVGTDTSAPDSNTWKAEARDDEFKASYRVRPPLQNQSIAYLLT